MCCLRAEITRQFILDTVVESWCNEEGNVQRAFLKQPDRKVTQWSRVSCEVSILSNPYAAMHFPQEKKLTPSLDCEENDMSCRFGSHDTRRITNSTTRQSEVMFSSSLKTSHPYIRFLSARFKSPHRPRLGEMLR